MKKRLLSVLLSAVMIGTIAGTAMPVMADDKEDIRVAGVVYLEDQFMKLMLAGYEAAAEHTPASAGAGCGAQPPGPSHGGADISERSQG